MSWRHMLAALALMTAVSLGACGSSGRTDAATLAAVGQTAAAQMEQNVTLTEGTYAALRKAVIFEDGFANDIDNPDSRGFLDQEAQIGTKLAAYGSMLEKLAGAYAALGDLAAFDASGSFSTASSSLCGSASTLITTLSSSRRVPDSFCDNASSGGGLVIGAVQSHQLIDASNRIEAVLQAVIPILADPNTRNLIVMNGALVQRQIVGAAKDLFASKVFSCGPVLDDLGAPLNLKPIAGADALVAANPNLRRGCVNAISLAAEETTEAVGKSYDKSVEGLNALIPLHERLKAGASLNLTTIDTIVTSLQGFATKLQSAKGT
jgi:hypothetical protein